MYTLNLGAGCSGLADVKIDLVDYAPMNPIDHVLDLAVDPIPYPDETFDKIWCSHTLEHIPTQLRWKEGGKWNLRFCRVELMREIWRVLKFGGVLRAAVPLVTGEGWNQDPSHVGPPWSLTQFYYFCGEWGGDKTGHEATVSSGIDFRFKLIKHFEEPPGFALTVETDESGKSEIRIRIQERGSNRNKRGIYMPGARHTIQETAEIQKIHDTAVELGAMCKGPSDKRGMLYAQYMGIVGKAGARHSQADITLIQQAHDDACELGAKCPESKAGNIFPTNVRDFKNTLILLGMVRRGGPTSGNWGHVGVPGKHGG